MTNSQNVQISVVVPVYRCGDALEELHARLVQTFAKLGVDFELIFVDDASPDNAWAMIRQIADKDARVHGIKFSRNFGQHAAITAGLEQARGAWVVVMDGDLQDQPEEIATLYAAVQKIENVDIVVARRDERNDNAAKRLASDFFYRVLSFLTDTKLDARVANFGIYRREVIDAICSLPERMRFFPVMVQWVGFRATSVSVAHAARPRGASSYSFGKLLHLAFDVMVEFSNKPLRLTVQLGLLLSCTAFIAALIVLIRALLGLQPVQGWPSLAVSIWFFSGLIIMILGIVGLYIGKIFDEVKHRPLFIIQSRYERN